MAVPPHTNCSSVFIVIILCLEGFLPKILGSETLLSFAFEGFDKNGSFNSAIALYGDAQVEGSAVRMTHSSAPSAGKILYTKPIKFLPRNPGFSTYFCFSVPPAETSNLAFFLDSSDSLLFGRPKNVLFVEFTSNVSGSSIGIRIRLKSSAESCNFSADSLPMSSGRKLHSWVDYDVFSKRIDVRLSKSRALRQSTPFISCPVDMSNSLLHEEALIVGILSSSIEHSTAANNSSTHGSYIYSWSFIAKAGAPYLLHSEPLNPRSHLAIARDGSRVHPRKTFNLLTLMAWLFGLVCGGMMACLLVFAWIAIASRRPVAAVEYPEDVHHQEVAYAKVEMVGEKNTKHTPT